MNLNGLKPYEYEKRYKGSDGRTYGIVNGSMAGGEGRRNYYACLYKPDDLYPFLKWTRLHLEPLFTIREAKDYLENYADRHGIEIKEEEE